MLKQDAINAFGGVVRLAEALGVKHPSISALPPVLSLRHADQVRGALVRLRKRIPPHLRTDANDQRRLAQLHQGRDAMKNAA